MSVSAHLWCGAISLAARLAWAAEEAPPPPRIVPAAAPADALALPRLAVVTDRDPTGTRWEMSGEMAVALRVAARDFASAMRRQGWRVVHTIPLDEGGARAELWTWAKGSRRLLVMLTEGSPKETFFFVGEVKEQTGRAQAQTSQSAGVTGREKVPPLGAPDAIGSLRETNAL